MTTKTGFKRWSRPGLWTGLLYGLMAAAGCGRPGGPNAFSASQSEFPIPDSGAPPSPIGVQTAPTCTPAQTSAPNAFPARTTIAGATPGGGAQDNLYRTSDLFGLFKTECGGCHVDNTDGGFQVTQSGFPTVVSLRAGGMGAEIYQLITSNDTSGNPATSVMPPYGIGYGDRASSDAVVQLATLLNQWLMQGSPPTSFTLATQTSGASAGYAMSASLGAQLTNLGSCVPNKAAVGTSADAMNQLDSFFAQATQLPATLDQTDLVSLDSATLAETGVISYAPTYPLWSDDAGKMRYVRVPVGQSIVFDKAKQTFSIPPNTRFYKTFLKQVTDANGNPTYRKIETRLIVSRPDTTKSDGSAQQNALFGTYIWNPDESQASLSNQPLRNNTLFADQIFPYITDEAKDKTIIANNPASAVPGAEDAAGITRHYAVPGSARCIQCHMGSPSQSFVLGFTPLQVARRPDGEGGVYEPAAGDELTQVQRLLDYGVITGLTSQQDILPLEEAEGSRLPRNQYELNAQAYMVGNCAHCHNPRGYPSVRQPAVADVLIFLPGSGPNEGIFQFPLETMSPIRQRGVNQDVPIPYITPSLYDMPSDEAIGKYFCQDIAGGCKAGPQWILAPWRSLIYRNTDTPYDYFDDYTAFPHMPLNTSGYDCRVAKLLGDWMVSIPSRVKNPSMPQNLLPTSTPTGTFAGSNANNDPQPYEEAFPSDSDYSAALGGAAARLQAYHARGFRYGFCPNSYTADIVDPVIAAQANANVTVTSDVGLGTFSPTDPTLLIMPPLAPIRPDYVALDDTDPPGPWLPRRPDWATALVNPDVASFVTADTNSDHLTAGQAEDLTNVMTALENVRLTADMRTALTQKYPFGLWDTSKPGCNFSGVPTAGSYTGADRPQWMSVAPPTENNAPVFVESSGAAIFTTICFNCHGTKADSQGLLADEITNLTGGDARVADFRDGFLGPVSAPGMNRTAVFGDSATTLGITVDDLSSRYMAWMALGGTNKHLPQDVLNEVSLAPVLGKIRGHVPLQGTPDMLRLGLNLCEQLAGSDDNAATISLQDFVRSGQMGWSKYTGLVDSNGDAEMWLRLCNLGNRQMVRALDIQGSWTATTSSASLFANGQHVYWARSLPTATSPTGDDWYGANPVMDSLGNLQTGVTPDNLFPMCVLPKTNPAQLQAEQQALQASPVLGKNVIPLCPEGFAVPAHQLQLTPNGSSTDYVEGKQWAARGAINAALAVFLYLDAMERDPTQRQPLYTQCNLLGGQQ